MSQSYRMENAIGGQDGLRYPMVFLLLFTVFYIAMYGGYFLLPDAVLRDIFYHHGICDISAMAINLIVPGENATAVDNTIRSQRAILEIVRGCDGAGAMFLLLAAILAFPAPWKLKIIGFFLGALLAYAINQTRIVALYFVVAENPAWFTALHTFYLPTFVVLLYAALFGAWAFMLTRHR